MSSEPTAGESTPAIEALRELDVAHRVVVTTPARDPVESAQLQGIELAQLVRTIVVRRAADDYVFVLVPADRRFDWPRLRAYLGTSRLSLPDADEAQAVTGYERGAITPFAARRQLPVIADTSILEQRQVTIGGGRRGLNVHLAPSDLVSATAAEVAPISVAEAPVHR